MVTVARPSHMMKPGILAIAAAGIIVLGGCSSKATNMSASSDSAADMAGGVATGSALNTLRAPMSMADAAKAPANPAVLGRKVISKGSIHLETKDVSTTRKRVLDLVAGWQGSVSNEQTDSTRTGTMESTHLVLRVPSATFDKAMADLAATAHAISQQRTAEDVTTKVIDTNARVQAKRRAVQQLQRLLDRATTLGQVIRLEGDISDRQAELESLRQQQTWLNDQTSMSTITVDIDRTATTHHKKTQESGLFAGLEGGWHALGAVVTGVLTAVGAVLPFAVVLAIVGLPVWLVRRRRTRAA